MKFRVLTRINHDGQVYEEGSTLDLDPDTAAPLLNVEAIEVIHKPFAGTLNPLLKAKS